jgi:predicted O-methyltransferase YrrM
MKVRNSKRDPVNLSDVTRREWDRVFLRSVTNSVPIVGDGAADILTDLLILKRPSRILEIGTGIGYSTFFLNAFKENEGIVVTVESNLDRYREAIKSFEAAGVSREIIAVYGKAEQFLSTYEVGAFDFVFIDGQKSQYCMYLELLKNLLTKDGIIVADDTMFRADRGIGYSKKHHENTVTGLETFREMIETHPWRSTTFPVEDGISLIWRCKENV